jgi:hypothetical protein
MITEHSFPLLNVAASSFAEVTNALETATSFTLVTVVTFLVPLLSELVAFPV